MNKQNLPFPLRPIWARLLSIFGLVIVVLLVVLVLSALPLRATAASRSALSAAKLFADSDVGPELMIYSLTYQLETVQEPQIIEPLQGFADTIGRKMGFPGPIRLNVVRHSQPEALSAPPNYLLLTTGMLASVSSEDQLAGVIARELSHIQLRHPILALSRFRMMRSAADEFAADRAAVSFLASAGYDPQQFPDFLRKLGRENAAAAYLADRPDLSLRLIALESSAEVEGSRKRVLLTARLSAAAKKQGKPVLSPAVAELIASVRTLYPPHRRPHHRPSNSDTSSVFGQ